jgi:hypothetical protein
MPLFEPFVYKNDHFTKTGSGQTQGKLKKEGGLCRALEHFGNEDWSSAREQFEAALEQNDFRSENGLL